MPTHAPYKFGSMSAALLGVSLSSDGKIILFASQRPPAISDGAPAPAMKDLYRSSPLTLSGKGSVDFTLTLAEKNRSGTRKEGIVALGSMIWPRIYPGVHVFCLGSHDHLGAVDIDYASFGPMLRPASIPSNRSIAFTFHYDPQASDPRQRAVLVCKDKDCGDMMEQRFAVSALDDLPNAHGGVVVSIQVDPANYDDGCATLEFTSGEKFAVTRSDTGAVVPNLSKLVLNTTCSPLVLADGSRDSAYAA